MHAWQQRFPILGFAVLSCILGCGEAALGYGPPDPEGVYLSCPDALGFQNPDHTIRYYVPPTTHHQVACYVYHGGNREVGVPVDISLLQASPGSTIGAPESNTTDANGLFIRTIYVGGLSTTANILKATVLDSAGNTMPHVYVPTQYYLYVEDHSTPTVTPTPLPAGITLDSTVYPNPFNPLHGESAHLYYKLAADAPVKISLYTLRGNLVYERSYHAGDAPGGKQGINVVDWNGRNGQDVSVANGVYVCVIRVNDKESYRLKVGLYKGE